ncbi:50S ribosomal protein L3 [Anaerohalosphaera lusitana]|uniref:Large ribosomal subunit protein uL3 n=1 Tax=Anaerohalosphaera lusitana TaxID=1936003 RepID=A0A1U9NPL0_9BACT|nr:50S ribosomal protein L3 [Anaerohalosphaera lusitana]AQT69853.1 50S ribosomal protein L3 [Anaerohalosphaera lusitana]
MAMLLGKKIGMTQVYDEEGKIAAVTVIQAGPCVVTQVKTPETDGYSAVQLGYDDVKKSRVKQAAAGHAKKANTTAKRFIREWRLDEGTEPEVNLGDEVTVSAFAEIKSVDVVGTSKGKGFAGVMKRHGFGGFPQSHGTKRMHRHAGSIAGHSSDAGSGGNVKKGKRMAGQMGCDRVTSKNHQLVGIDEEKNLLIVKGSVAGASGGYVEIRASKGKK